MVGAETMKIEWMFVYMLALLVFMSSVQLESFWTRRVGSRLQRTASSFGLALTFESVRTMSFHLVAKCALCISSHLCHGSLTLLMC